MKKVKMSHAVGVIALGALVVLSGCSKKDDKAAQMAAMMGGTPKVGVMTVDFGSVDLSQSYPATIKGKTDIDVRPQVSGFITQVAVDEGQHVIKGQTLFVIDQVQFQAAVDQAQAQVNAARTAVESARMTADQKQKLFDKNIISEYENQLAKNDLATAKASLATAEAALTNARKNLAYTVVTAPSNGVVGSIPFREGSLASPSMAQPLTTISDNSEVYAYFSMTEKELLEKTNNGASSVDAAIKAMPAVQLRLADGSIFPEEGRVSTVSGVIGNGTGAATVRALFKNYNGMLRSGSTGQVLVPMRQDSVIVIPQKATYELQGRRFVYVVGDSNRIEVRPIGVSPISDGQTFVVTSGLDKGEIIAVQGVGVSLQPNMNGATIEPIDASQAEAMAQEMAAQQAAAAAQAQGK